MKNNKLELNKTVIEEPKQIELEVHEVEKDSVIVNVDGWRIRVYKDRKLDTGRTITASYYGDLKDVHSLKFLPLTSK